MTRTDITAADHGVDAYSRHEKTRKADAADHGRKARLLLAASGLFAAAAVWFTAAFHIAATVN